MKQYENTIKFAVCIDNAEYPASLEMHKLYRMLPDDDAALDGDIRIVDESGEDYLYPKEFFLLIDIPDDRKNLLINSYTQNYEYAAA
ncbi:conserved hypothetical protein [Candidatus Magnetomoraceae bacterium gMMP-15]